MLNAPLSLPDTRKAPREARRHELRFTPSSALATCRCGEWTYADQTGKPLSHEAVKQNYGLHRRMVQLPASARELLSEAPTGEDPHVSTFPEAFFPMRDHFVQQARQHPAFRFMTPVEVVQSIENRLWTIINQRQDATGKKPEPREFIMK